MIRSRRRQNIAISSSSHPPSWQRSLCTTVISCGPLLVGSEGCGRHATHCRPWPSGGQQISNLATKPAATGSRHVLARPKLAQFAQPCEGKVTTCPCESGELGEERCCCSVSTGSAVLRSTANSCELASNGVSAATGFAGFRASTQAGESGAEPRTSSAFAGFAPFAAEDAEPALLVVPIRSASRSSSRSAVTAHSPVSPAPAAPARSPHGQ